MPAALPCPFVPLTIPEAALDLAPWHRTKSHLFLGVSATPLLRTNRKGVMYVFHWLGLHFVNKVNTMNSDMSHHILDWTFLHNTCSLQSPQSPRRNLLPSTPSCSRLAADSPRAKKRGSTKRGRWTQGQSITRLASDSQDIQMVSWCFQSVTGGWDRSKRVLGSVKERCINQLLLSVINGLGELCWQPPQAAKATPSQPPPTCALVLLGTKAHYVGTNCNTGN